MSFWNEIAALAVKFVVAAIGIIFSAIVLPWIKTTAIPWLNEKHLYGVVKRFVMAAEKEFSGAEGAGAEKKIYVISHLEKAGIHVNETVKALIEAAVEELDLVFDNIWANNIGLGDLLGDDEDEVDDEDVIGDEYDDEGASEEEGA